MQFLLEQPGALQRRLIVQFPAQSVEAQARARLLALGKTAQLRGFRAGKVPQRVLEQTFGAKARTEALTEAVSVALREALSESGQRPALAPVLTECAANGDQIEFTAEFEVYPEVPTLDVSTLSLTAFESAVEDADVDASIAALQAEHQRLDEAFLLGIGIKEGGMAALRGALRAELQQQLDAAIWTRNKTEVIRQLSAAHADIEVPQGLIDNEVNALIAHAQTNAPLTADELAAARASLATEAQVRVRAFILLAEIARQNEIVPDQNRINTTLARIASEYDEPHKVVELYAADADLMATLRNRVIEDQAIDWVFAHASVTHCRVACSALVPTQSLGSDGPVKPAVD
jgi:FKBP-type peptidyl-prolyl cis-trans isomerase (trigger factor)